MLLTLFCVIVGVEEDLDEFTSNVDGKCRVAKLTTNFLFISAYGLTNNGTLYDSNYNSISVNVILLKNFNFIS